MPRKAIKCPKCDRTFKMSLHLARHMAAAHRSKVKSVQRPRPARPAKPKARAPRLQAGPEPLLGDVRAWRNELAGQQAQLGVQIAALDQLLATFGASAPRTAVAARPVGGKRRGGLREGSLKSYIDRVLRASAKPMRVVQITAAVLKAGYKTKNKALAKSVGVALREMPGMKQVGRGTFRAA